MDAIFNAAMKRGIPIVAVAREVCKLAIYDKEIDAIQAYCFGLYSNAEHFE